MGLVGKLFGGSRPPENDVYQSLRNRALNVTTTELGLEPDPKAPIHAVIMETGYPEAVATFLVLAGPHPRSLLLGGRPSADFPPAPRSGRRRLPASAMAR